MKVHNFAIGALALSLFVTPAFAQSGVGSAAVSGPAKVDGVSATGTVQLGGTARVATGDAGSVAVSLSNGGQITLAASSDAIVTSGPDGTRVHLVCGELTINGGSPVTVIGPNGVRVKSDAGTADVTEGATTKTVKAGKQEDRDGVTTVKAGAPGSTTVITSKVRCSCI